MWQEECSQVAVAVDQFEEAIDMELLVRTDS